MNATPPTPSSRPKALRQVIGSRRNAAASAAVSTGFALAMMAASPADMRCIPT
jgi:hypothetical protein